jgi:hypothetical protein
MTANRLDLTTPENVRCAKNYINRVSRGKTLSCLLVTKPDLYFKSNLSGAALIDHVDHVWNNLNMINEVEERCAHFRATICKDQFPVILIETPMKTRFPTPESVASMKTRALSALLSALRTILKHAQHPVPFNQLTVGIRHAELSVAQQMEENEDEAWELLLA